MKKQKIEKRPTRARRAVKSVVIMLCALLVCRMLSGGNLTRGMAIHDGEERRGVYEKTHELASLPAESIYRTMHVTLMAGENAAYCGASHFYALYGWQDDFGMALDCSSGERVHAGWWVMGRGGGGRALFFWGRVDDAAIDRAEILQQRTVDVQSGEYVVETVCTTPLVWLEDGGHRYFLAGGAITQELSGDYGSDEFLFVGYDEAENEVLRYEIERQMSTSFA